MEYVLGIGLAFANAVSKTATDLTSKFAMGGMGGDRTAEVRVMAVQWTVAAILLCAGCAVQYPDLVTNPIQTLISLTQPDVWWIVALDGFLNVIAFFCYLRAFKNSDASLVAPMMLLTPIILLFTSPIMLGESIPPLGIVGVLITVFGSYRMGKTLPGGLSGSARALLKDTGVRYMLATSALWGIAANLDKMGMQASTPFLWSGLISLVMAIFSIAIWQIARPWLPKKQVPVWKAAIPGVTVASGIVAQTFAMVYLYVPYVIAIKRLSAIMTVIAGGKFLKEDIKGRLISALIMFAGVPLMLLA